MQKFSSNVIEKVLEKAPEVSSLLLPILGSNDEIHDNFDIGRYNEESYQEQLWVLCHPENYCCFLWKSRSLCENQVRDRKKSHLCK
jgi:hypothetical protein